MNEDTEHAALHHEQELERFWWDELTDEQREKHNEQRKELEEIFRVNRKR